MKQITAEEFFRTKLKEQSNSDKEITLSTTTITAEQGMRWAHEYKHLYSEPIKEPDGYLFHNKEYATKVNKKAKAFYFSPVLPQTSKNEEEIKQEFKELNKYLSDLSIQKEKDSGNLWIQLIDKFSAFEKLILSALSIDTAKQGGGRVR